jgi:type II secretion system protein G
MRNRKNKNQRGFTLIELLVVVAIIGVLSSVVLASLNVARQKARASKAVSELGELRTAIETYQIDNGTYPASSGAWGGLYTCWGTASGSWIQGLVPQYIPTLPREPTGTTDCDKHYIYASNGTDYKLIWHNAEGCSTLQSTYPSLRDPVRVTPPGSCAIGYWSAGGIGF